ncbi:MAG TPA: hypothetical protein VK519_10155 [Pinirhizobacter sp.]|uniref:hypothetical protein n=1 Tax=Pinirhizobacter sp. TaxID=2950432 RepID=UPI002B8F7AAD|nr:hypothetical protein [Pinirhizobacter sp.]HMH68273.1 hypothetical protein [Pinirhizobacter sp.]
MTWRTPPSLHWLIKKRARLSGAISIIDADLARIREQIAQLETERLEVERQLAAVDITMTLHEIRVSPNSIRPMKKHRPRAFPYGGLSKLLRKTLKASADWVATPDLATVSDLAT